MNEIKKRIITNHSFQINRAGVNTLYAIFALINQRYTDFVFRRFVDTTWTKNQVVMAHLPYAVRRAEFPWDAPLYPSESKIITRSFTGNRYSKNKNKIKQKRESLLFLES